MLFISSVAAASSSSVSTVNSLDCLPQVSALRSEDPRKVAFHPPSKTAGADYKSWSPKRTTSFNRLRSFNVKNIQRGSSFLVEAKAIASAPEDVTVRTAVLGASGYTGAEIVRILSLHPNVELRILTADRKAGKTFASVFPHLSALKLPDLISVGGANFDDIDAVFCCLPHGTTQEIIAKLPAHVKIVDLSADFRLKNVDTYAKWYGHEHQAPELQKDAVYGLVELARDEIANARLIANPGCYPTCSQLPLLPLIKSNLIDPEDITIDAKSGVSGAGRGAKENLLFTEIQDGMNAYGVASHRHAPEIEQGVSDAANKDVIITFTPHLIPMSRGMLTTSYVKMMPGVTLPDLRACLTNQYKDEYFVHVLEEGVEPATRHVRGSNHCLMQLYADRKPGHAIIVSVIDNLVKGASGQAIQNMNLLFGLPEQLALEQQPMFP